MIQSETCQFWIFWNRDLLKQARHQHLQDEKQNTTLIDDPICKNLNIVPTFSHDI